MAFDVRLKWMITKETLFHYVTLRSDKGGTITLMGADQIDDHVQCGVLEEDYEKMWDIFAASSEEASAIHAMRLGWHPYNPIGEPQLCPRNCGSYYYPQGSAQCPLCGPVDQPQIQPAEHGMGVKRVPR